MHLINKFKYLNVVYVKIIQTFFKYFFCSDEMQTEQNKNFKKSERSIKNLNLI